MNNNNKMNFINCIKVVRNIFLTGDSKTDFQYVKDTQDENANLKNNIMNQ